MPGEFQPLDYLPRQLMDHKTRNEMRITQAVAVFLLGLTTDTFKYYVAKGTIPYHMDRETGHKYYLQDEIEAVAKSGLVKKSDIITEGYVTFHQASLLINCSHHYIYDLYYLGGLKDYKVKNFKQKFLDYKDVMALKDEATVKLLCIKMRNESKIQLPLDYDKNKYVTAGYATKFIKLPKQILERLSIAGALNTYKNFGKNNLFSIDELKNIKKQLKNGISVSQIIESGLKVEPFIELSKEDSIEFDSTESIESEIVNEPQEENSDPIEQIIEKPMETQSFIQSLDPNIIQFYIDNSLKLIETEKENYHQAIRILLKVQKEKIFLLESFQEKVSAIEEVCYRHTHEQSQSAESGRLQAVDNMIKAYKVIQPIEMFIRSSNPDLGDLFDELKELCQK